MKIIGGQIPIKADNLFYYFTDSGRSSIKLIFSSYFLRHKKVVIPNFICSIVPKTLEKIGINFTFYTVDENLQIDISYLEKIEYDVIYYVSYFGRRDIDSLPINPETIVVEDNVFLPDFHKPAKFKMWFGFNSFRKISPIPEGSMIKSTIKLKDSHIENKQADFVRLCYEGKNLKYKYLHSEIEDISVEQKYLEMFSKSENLLNMQTGIYFPSCKSFYYIFDFFYKIKNEHKMREDKFKMLELAFKKYKLLYQPEFYSFFVMKINERDKIRNQLMKHGVYLPIHWPTDKYLKHPLCNSIISIPVDSRYTIEDMQKIITLLKDIASF